MPRQARLDAPGTLHHVMVRGIEKKPIVKTDVDRKDFVDRLGRLARDTKSPVYAWALMTNHAHILLRSGPKGLSALMRRLLTGYAIAFNRRHRRYGHLFQNRYKSIICDEDAYFQELVRYIHLNPLRAGLVKTLSALDKYRWCGHSVVMGRTKQEWHHSADVLAWFGKSNAVARRAYRNYVQQGITLGRRPDLVGGGLIRSQGGWSQVIAMRSRKGQELADERILGSGDFVARIIEEAEDDFSRSLKNKLSPPDVTAMIAKACQATGLSVKELKSGSRRASVSTIRAELALDLVKQHGLTLAQTARYLGVSTPGISKLLRRKGSGS